MKIKMVLEMVYHKVFILVANYYIKLIMNMVQEMAKRNIIIRMENYMKHTSTRIIKKIKLNFIKIIKKLNKNIMKMMNSGIFIIMKIMK